MRRSISRHGRRSGPIARGRIWGAVGHWHWKDGDSGDGCGSISSHRTQAAAALGDDVARKMRILYGGSVKPENAKALMSEEEIDGALVGGASLDPKAFAAIVKY